MMPAARVTRPPHARLVGPRFGPFALVGVIVAFMGLAIVVVGETAPWLHEYDSEGLDQEELGGLGDYVDGIFSMAKTGGILLVVTGILLVVLDMTPNLAGLRYGGRILGLLLGVFGGFLATLAALRMAGLVIDDIMDVGSATITLHAASYVCLLFGVAALVACMSKAIALERHAPGARTDIPASRTAMAAFLVAAGTLAVMPLLPYYFEEDFSGDRNAGEGEFALANFRENARGDDTPLESAGKDYHAARAMMWTILATSLFAWCMLSLSRLDWNPRAFRWASLTFVAMGIPIVLMAVFLILFYVHLLDGDNDTAVGFNFFPIVGLIGTGIAYGMFAGKVARPMVDDLRLPKPQDKWE